jgi:hypothetical protein
MTELVLCIAVAACAVAFGFLAIAAVAGGEDSYEQTIREQEER